MREMYALLTILTVVRFILDKYPLKAGDWDVHASIYRSKHLDKHVLTSQLVSNGGYRSRFNTYLF